jgi:hypothetical protein
MATRVGMPMKKEPVTTPAPAETILPEVTEELEKALKPKKKVVTKRSTKAPK